MSVLNIQYGQTAFVNPQIEYVDSGWVVDGQYATHYPCYPGTMSWDSEFPFVNGEEYDFSYVVDDYASGLVRLDLGASTGTSHSVAGEFIQTFTYGIGDVLKFYSDGDLRVTLLSIAPHIEEPVENFETFAFHEPSNKWVENYSWQSEMMLNFGSRFFTFKNGQLWEHETNPVAANFYGVKYPVEITLVVNNEYEKDKLWYNIRFDSKGAWFAPEITIPASDQFPNGMLTRLKKNNVQLIDGKRWAAILRDITDPNYAAATPVEALYKARQMQGGVLVVRLRCNDDAQSSITSLEFYFTDVERSI
jgi:hypothetical protein